MRASLIAFVFVLASCHAVRAQESVISRLKAYRTYYAVQKVEPAAHRFTAWFVDIEPTRVELALDTVDQAENLTADQMEGSWGAFGVPPPTIPPVPVELTKLAHAIEARIRELRPNASSILVGYNGYKRMLRVLELTPLGLPGGEPSRRIGRHTELSLAQTPGSNELEPYGIQLYGGLGLLCWGRSGADCDVTPNFVHYQLSPPLEGSSALYARGILRPMPAIYAAEWAKLRTALSDAADRIAAGTYINPIEKLLSEQGGGTLPSQLNSWFEFSVTAYGRTANWNDQASDELTFSFATASALGTTVSARHASAETGIDYNMAICLGDGNVSLDVRGPSGDMVRAKGQLKARDFGGLIVDGDSVAIQQGAWEIEWSEGRNLTLPGHGAFTSFDVYAPQEVYVRQVNVGEPIERSTTGAPRATVTKVSP